MLAVPSFPFTIGGIMDKAVIASWMFSIWWLVNWEGVDADNTVIYGWQA
jgi:hypothetical protein